MNEPIRADSLDLDALPERSISRVLVRIAEDGLGGALRVPVLVARGRPGPVFGVTAALHGNELNGVPIVHRLFENLDVSALRGTLVGVVVLNVPGYLLRQRPFNDGQDLNRLFPGRADGNGGQVWAHRVYDRIINRFDSLVDLHTASGGRVNSLYIRANLDDEVTRRMALRMRPQIVVHNPAPDGTLRGYCQSQGMPAITVEVGNPARFQRDLVRASLAGIRAVLRMQGLLAKRTEKSERPMPVICERSAWQYTDRGGVLEVLPQLTDRVEKDEVYARVRDAFGTVVREYKAPHDAVVIGKSIDPVSQTGARLVHFGVEADPGRFVIAS